MLFSEYLFEAPKAAVRQFKRTPSGGVKIKYRCGIGDRKGRLVSNSGQCGVHKDPKKVRAGKISSRRNKGQRVRKTAVTKSHTLTKLISRWNKRLSKAR